MISDVRSKSPANRLGLQPGDMLTKVAGEEVEKVEDFARAFKRQSMANTVLMLVYRDGRGYYVRLRI